MLFLDRTTYRLSGCFAVTGMPAVAITGESGGISLDEWLRARPHGQIKCWPPSSIPLLRIPKGSGPTAESHDQQCTRSRRVNQSRDARAPTEEGCEHPPVARGRGESWGQTLGCSVLYRRSPCHDIQPQEMTEAAIKDRLIRPVLRRPHVAYT